MSSGSPAAAIQSCATIEGLSNCTLCAPGSSANKLRVYACNETDADHSTVWSKGGKTDCDLPYVWVQDIEEQVERYYQTIKLALRVEAWGGVQPVTRP